MSTKNERTEQIAKLKEAFESATALYFTKYEGMTVEEISKVRTELREVNATYTVVKNTLAVKALAELNIEGIDSFLKGPVGVAITSDESAAGPAKVINKYNKENDDKMEMKVAYFDGTTFEGEQAKSLANLPSREDLYSMFLSCLNAPITKFAGTMNGILENFVRTVDAVRIKKEAE